MELNLSSIRPPVSGDAAIPREADLLSKRLVEIHGSGYYANEKNGLHLYLASPQCLLEDGEVELHKRHMSVNLARYLGMGRHSSLSDGERDLCALCMKYRKPYTITELLKMPPLAQRNIVTKGQPTLFKREMSKLVETDANGNVVPEMPTCIVPVTQLPPDHPAAVYLTSRSFNLQKLWEQFETSFCWQELPEDREKGRYYRKLPGGFKVTPQGRILFKAFQNGVRVGWQARVIDFTQKQTDGTLMKAYLHPYRQQFEWCEFLPAGEDGKMRPLPHLAGDPDRKWDMIKYATATGMFRSDCVMGLDAALAWNKARGTSICVLGEGPLDAGRVGPPGLAMLGDKFTPGQIELVLRFFRHIVYVADNDRVGELAMERVRAAIAGKATTTIVAAPKGWVGVNGDPVKDLGSMLDAQWKMLCIQNKLQVLLT